MRCFVHELKERILYKDEVLFRDGTKADYIYFLLKGKLRVEKEVDVEAVNYWP
jgi:CRP-like cAMP-binding protein